MTAASNSKHITGCEAQLA